MSVTGDVSIALGMQPMDDAQFDAVKALVHSPGATVEYLVGICEGSTHWQFSGVRTAWPSWRL